jgi:hypothetical protein
MWTTLFRIGGKYEELVKKIEIVIKVTVFLQKLISFTWDFRKRGNGENIESLIKFQYFYEF